MVKKRSLWGYLGDDWVSFLKIYTNIPRSVPTVRDECNFQSLPPAFTNICLGYARIFERGECNFMDLFGSSISTFESNIVYTLRFMIDAKVRQFVG